MKQKHKYWYLWEHIDKFVCFFFVEDFEDHELHNVIFQVFQAQEVYDNSLSLVKGMFSAAVLGKNIEKLCSKAMIQCAFLYTR